MQKKSRMRSLPYRHRERASRTGYIPADEDTLSLGLVSFPQKLLDYIEADGGLWDAEHPEGRPPGVGASGAGAAAPAAAAAAPLASPRASGPAVVVDGEGAGAGAVGALPAFFSSPPARAPWRPWHWLASLGWGSSASKPTEAPKGAAFFSLWPLQV